MTTTARIYFDGKGIDVAADSRVIDALEIENPTEAAAVRAGEREITDSRGLGTEPDATVYNGAIFRIVRARRQNNDDTSNQE